MSRNLRLAGMKEFASIKNKKLKRLVQTWIILIAFSVDIRFDDPDAEDFVVGGGTIAELKRARDQAVGDALGISLLDRQDQIQADKDAGIGPPTPYGTCCTYNDCPKCGIFWERCCHKPSKHGSDVGECLCGVDAREQGSCF